MWKKLVFHVDALLRCLMSSATMVTAMMSYCYCGNTDHGMQKELLIIGTI